MALTCMTWPCSLANDSTHLTSAAFGTFCKSTSLLMSPTMKSIPNQLNCLSLWQSRLGGWSCLDASFAPTQMRTMFALSMPASTNRQRTGDDLASVFDKVATHRRAGSLTTKHRAVSSQALCTRSCSLALSGGDGYAAAEACPMVMMNRT